MKSSRLLAILLAVMIVFSSMSCLSVVSSAAVIEGGEYDDKGVLTSKQWSYDDATGVLTLYAAVTDDSWSQYKNDIVKIVVTNSANAIDDFMFASLPKLSEVVFETNVSYIGKGAFQYCNGITKLVLPAVNSIGDYAFYNCDNLEEVTIGGGLETVGKNIFKECDALKTVNIVNGVITIGEGMFEDCTALETVVLPDSIENIARLAFENCGALTDIVIPDSTRIVGEYAFYDCSSAKTLYIGHNVEAVGEYAFGKCSALESVEVKCAMPAISEGMFYGCSSLKGLSNLPEGIKTIGKNAFKDCTSFAEIVLPSTVVEIGDSAFDATAITEIDIPVGVELIGSGAFTNCDKLVAINVEAKNRNYVSEDGVLYDITLGSLILCPAGKSGEVAVREGAQAIAEDSFIGCKEITKITIPNSVTEIADNAFNGCADALEIACDCDSYAATYAKARGIATKLNHVGGEAWRVKLEATCINDGVKELVCSACDFPHQEEIITALGHNYSSVITTNATCETKGVKTFTCTRSGCEETYAEDIPALGHKYDKGVVTVEPTCEAEGVKTFTCQNADCDDFYTESIPALGHKYDKGVVTLEPTCEAEGVKTFTCQNPGCDDSYTESIPALGHKYDKGVVTLEPTCEAEGVKTFTCQNKGCGDSYTESIPALTHNYTETVVKQGTCITKGLVEYKCENCGDKYDVREYGEHQLYSYAVRIEPTCDEEGKEGNMCALCHEFIGEVTILPATSHTEGKWVVDKKATCTAAGSKHKSCTSCGTVLATEEIAALGHSEGEWITDKKATVNAAGKKHKECTECGETLKTAAISQLKCSSPQLDKVSNSSKGLKFTWSKVNGADSYRVYRKTKNGEWKYIGSTKKTSYVDETVKSGTRYYYSICASNEAGNSERSNTRYRFCLEDPNLKSATSAKKGITLKWSKVAGAEGYIVYRKTDSGSFEKIKTVDGKTSFTDKTAKKGKKYTYKVRAYNSGIRSAYSNTKALTDKY